MLNAANLARALGVDGKTIAGYLDLLVDLLLVRRLPAWHRGANLIVNDVLGGHLMIGAIALSAAAGQLKVGAVRGLAISTEQRLPDFPDVPTFKEQGYPDLVASTWFALSGPASLPPEIVNRLNVEVVKAVHAPDVQARFAQESINTKSHRARR